MFSALGKQEFNRNVTTFVSLCCYPFMAGVSHLGAILYPPPGDIRQYLETFFWLRQVLVAARGIFIVACGIFRCSTQALPCGTQASL